MNDAPTDALLSCAGLAVARGRREVVTDVSLELRRGEIVALLGPNGAGKSTLLDALSGALAATRGSIERHGRIAVALQAPDLARRTVLANVNLALAWWGVPRAERAERAGDALSMLGVEQLASRPAAALSGGERRRVHLARAMAVRPDVLMLDEPFAGLDAGTRAELLDDTGSALRTAAAAALVVVHDRAEAWALADRLLILIGGRLVAEGSPRELLDHPPTIEVARFLGFDGTLSEPGGSTVLTRSHHVQLDQTGSLRATVARVIPVEDGVRLELALDNGRLFAFSPLPAPTLGESVGVRVSGGTSFPDVGQEPTDVPAAPVQTRSP
jgi:ABC-type nitrate/sulfonate/bicarbonate transport system ATPase subunit